MADHPQIVINDPQNMGIQALPDTFLEVPNLTAAPITLRGYIIFAQGSCIHVATADARVLCQTNVEHPITCISTYRHQGCDTLVVGTEDGLLLLFNNINLLIELGQAHNRKMRVTPDRFIHVATPSSKGASPVINGDMAVYCISLTANSQYPLLAAGLDNGSCLILSMETFTALAILKGSGYGVFQPDYNKMNLECKCSLIYDHFTDLLDHLTFLSQQQSGSRRRRLTPRLTKERTNVMTLNEDIYMDEPQLQKLSLEQVYNRLRDMYYARPVLCSSCNKAYGTILAHTSSSSNNLSNIPGDLYVSAEVVAARRSLPKSAKLKPVQKEYVTCFGPQANPSVVYLQASFERNSHLGCAPDIASCLCWVVRPEDAVETTITKISTKFLTLLVGGDDYCICVYHIPVALLALASDSGIACNCRPHLRFYTHALNSYQTESLVGIENIRPPVYACSPLECQRGATMFDSVLMHGFIDAYGDIETILQVPHYDLKSSNVCVAIKSTLNGYSFYELSIELFGMPILDLAAYKEFYIPKFLLQMDKNDSVERNLSGIFPKQPESGRIFLDHSILYADVVSIMQEGCQGALLAFSVEPPSDAMLRRMTGPVLPIYQPNKWISTDVKSKRYEYKQVLPCAPWSFLDVQSTAMLVQIDGTYMLADFNRYGQVSFYSLEDIVEGEKSTSHEKPSIIYPRCAVECPDGRPLFTCLLNKRLAIAIYDIGLYFCSIQDGKGHQKPHSSNTMLIGATDSGNS